MALKKRSLFELVLSAGVLVLAAALFWQQDRIVDQMSVWQYQPPAEIIALADETAMTDSARFYFYASQPRLDDRETFNQSCTNHSEQTVILGCYVGKRIYIYNVNDERLPYVEEITAAHEMLHAVYERMGKSERERLDLLIDAAIKHNSDEHIASLIELYRVSEPDKLHNEMHSILGTESAKLSAELEEHYGQYFSDRSRLVTMSNQYKKVFNGLRAQQETLSREMSDLSKEIDARSAVYEGAIKTFEDKVRVFNQKARNGGFSTEAEYDSEYDQLRTEQSQLESEREVINSLVAAYNQKRRALKALIIETESLNESIDSRDPTKVPELSVAH